MKNYESLMQVIQSNPAVVNSYLQHVARYSERYNLEVLTFDELPWAGDADGRTAEIIDQLKQFGITEFWISESSTALNKALIRLMSWGVTITGGEFLTVPSPVFSWNEDIPVLKCKLGGNSNE